MSLLDTISLWAVPAMLALIPLWGAIRKVKVYDTFIEGAEEGLQVAVKIIPFLVGMMVALSVFRASGAMELVANAISPFTSKLGFPSEVLPLMIVRPLSGAGALAVTADLLKTHHPDSYIGRLASIMQGSTDTTFYVLTVYFGSVGIRKARYAAAVGLLADAVGFLAALYACNWFFR
ncbi:MAG TPA: spore maturation protein [Symbiobacteriaceae bacterium]|nr:spore maturation protein [Symbiobacteriaceae bacterium]